MKLSAINPFLPREAEAREEFQSTYETELRMYRKRPMFIGGLLVSLCCALWLLSRLDPLDRLIFFPIVAGLALAHDTITSHFVSRLIESRKAKH